jgi:hypothetical protein
MQAVKGSIRTGHIAPMPPKAFDGEDIELLIIIRLPAFDSLRTALQKT